MREMVRMVATLTILCILSGGILSFLKTYTAPLIEAQELNLVQGPAITSIFPSYTNNPVAERRTFDIDSTSVVVFPIKEGNTLIGVALEQSSPSYSGPLGAMVGFDVQTDTIVGVNVTTFKDTAGIGSRVYDEGFRKQFTALQASQDISGVSILSGATVSSSSFITSVRKAAILYLKLKNQLVADFT